MKARAFQTDGGKYDELLLLMLGEIYANLKLTIRIFIPLLL